MDVWDYFHQKEDEFRRHSVTPDRHMFEAAAGSDDLRGRVFGNLHFPVDEDAYLRVHEIVVVCARRHVHRLKYSYFLVFEGEEVGGFERDPTHDPPVHMHCGPKHVRTMAKPVPLKAVLERAWEEVSRRAGGP